MIHISETFWFGFDFFQLFLLNSSRSYCVSVVITLTAAGTLRYQKAFTHMKMLLQLVAPVRENTFVFLPCGEKQEEKPTDLSGRLGLVQTRRWLPLICRSLKLTGSPQTHGCDHMSFDLHVQ